MRPRRSAAEKLSSLPPKAMIGSGLFLIVCGLAWPEATALHGDMSPGGVDFIQGVLAGVGIACGVMGIAGLVAGRRKRTDDSA